MADYTGLGNNLFGGRGLQDSENAIGFVFPGVDPPDYIAPVVSNVSPASGAELSENDSISFDVTDNSGVLHAVSIYVRFPSTEIWEVVYYSGGFTPRYQKDSSRTAIANGYTFVISRWSGWPYAPQIIIDPVDGSGNISI